MSSDWVFFEPLPASTTAFSYAMHSLSDCLPRWACYCVKFVVDELLIVTGWPGTIQCVHPITRESCGWDLNCRGASDRGSWICCNWRCFGKRGRRLIRVRISSLSSVAMGRDWLQVLLAPLELGGDGSTAPSVAIIAAMRWPLVERMSGCADDEAR